MRTLTVQGKWIKPLEIMEYVTLIREETDINHLAILADEAKSLYSTPSQGEWIDREILTRKIQLNNF